MTGIRFKAGGCQPGGMTAAAGRQKMKLSLIGSKLYTLSIMFAKVSATDRTGVCHDDFLKCRAGDSFICAP